ncbi:cell adhesion molecule CEACAM1-like [Eucyclogobius newberryi]|uniref:cell adhesion molecule CEACAM1-like n=1 Tax=Eucyclogobius newberryi TaxID=166745 RepID=UPI003B594433
MGFLTFYVVAVAFTGFVSGAGVLPDSVEAAVGDTVMFTTSLPPTQTPFTLIDWSFGTKYIITSYPGVNYTTPDYEDRITLFISTGTLELRNVALTDTGEYEVTIVSAESGETSGKTTLNVYAPTERVTVTVSSSDLVEFISSVTLSCSAFGSSLSFLWLNGSDEVTASDRVSLTDGGATLTISTVRRSDQGPFRCQVSDPVSNSSSETAELSICYGPENVQISGPKEIHFDKTFKLSCFCDSVPIANYTWIKNGTILAQSSEYTKESAGSSDSGQYICRATNEITKKTVQASQRVFLRYTTTSDSACDTGCIVGIVCGCIVLALVMFGGGIYFLRKK